MNTNKDANNILNANKGANNILNANKGANNILNANRGANNILNANQSAQLINRLPLFELSYETISHKKVSSPKYDVCLAIPQSKKFYAWFSFFQDTNVCYIMELTRDKKIGNINVVDMEKMPEGIALGTLMYGSMIVGSSTGNSSIIAGSSTMNLLQQSSLADTFLIEDIFFYKGISLRNTTFGHKLGFLYEFMQKMETLPLASIQFHLPLMWGIPKSHYENKEYLENEDADSNTTNLPEDISKKVAYTVHHLQYRSLTTICPFLNKPANNSNLLSNNLSLSKPPDTRIVLPLTPCKLYTPDFSKPQYNYKTVFRVCADLQNDIYHLYAYGKNCELVYYDMAYIANYKTSVFMNNLFRKIKENQNLDYIEESEDEADFEDIRYDKYVDLTKELFIECSFHKKFKRWVPLRLVHAHDAKVVHISKLQGYREPTVPLYEPSLLRPTRFTKTIEKGRVRTREP